MLSIFYRWGKKKPQLVVQQPAKPVEVKPVIEKPTETFPQIDIVDVPGDRPKFERQYSTTLTTEHSGSVRVKIKLYNGYGGRYDMSEITQKNGGWILFDAHRPADKIIDRDLLPLVQNFCNRVLTLDNEFSKNPPLSFKDEGGTIWTRQPK